MRKAAAVDVLNLVADFIGIAAKAQTALSHRSAVPPVWKMCSPSSTKSRERDEDNSARPASTHCTKTKTTAHTRILGSSGTRSEGTALEQ